MRMIALPHNFTDVLWRVGLTAAVVALAAYATAQQVVFPQPRIIKVTVLFLLFVIMLRLQTVYSLYVFLILMPFPSGIALSSTNVILMTLIPLLWVVRARSGHQSLFQRTPLDGAIAFFLIAYILSFTHVRGGHEFAMSLKMLWRQLAALAFYYLIVTFVDDEEKLARITKVFAIAAGLLAFTGVVELFAPGSALVPGWIKTGGRHVTELGARAGGGMRIGGAVSSHSLIGDFVSMSLFFVVLHFLRARNPIENLFWVIVFLVSFPVVLATANRGAFAALVVGIGYSFWIFRRSLGVARIMVLIGAIVALFAAGEVVLTQYTNAASITQRMMETTFEGGIPNNRAGAWLPALQRSMEHIFVGHGPWYEPGIGLEKKAWPHNAYIFNLYTLGVLGLSAMLLIRYRVFKISFDGVRKYPPGKGQGFATTMMGILHVLLVMHLLHMGRTDFERPADTIYIFVAWMLFALIAATARIQAQAHAPPGMLESDDAVAPPPPNRAAPLRR